MTDVKIKTDDKNSCGTECEVYSRVCGYFRPVANWNKGKREEFKERRKFHVKGSEQCECQ